MASSPRAERPSELHWGMSSCRAPTAPEGCRVVYPVCLQQIVQLGDTTTNYQIQPGDRIFVPSRGMLEGLLPQRCQKPAGACARPQVSCFGSGGCAAPVGPMGWPGIATVGPSTAIASHFFFSAGLGR